jgi:hypothetical protein
MKRKKEACQYCFKAFYSDEFSPDFESAYKEILEYIKEEGYINRAGDNDVENYDIDVYPVYDCSQKIENQEQLKNQTWGDVKIGDICDGLTAIDEEFCESCGRPNQLFDRVIVDWADISQFWPERKPEPKLTTAKPLDLTPKANPDFKIRKTEEYISILFNSLKSGTKKSLRFFVKELQPGKCDMMLYHIGYMYLTDPKLVLLFSKEMYWFTCRLFEQSIILNLSDENKSNSQYLKSLIKSINEVKKSVRKKYADYLLNSSWTRKSVFDLIKGKLLRPNDKDNLHSFEAYNIEYIEDELKNYIEKNKENSTSGENFVDVFSYNGSAIIDYIRENHKKTYAVVQDGFMDRAEILERRYVENTFSDIRHDLLSNMGPWPDSKQRESFKNQTIEYIVNDNADNESVASKSEDILEEELKKIKSLFDKKLINEDEYKRKKEQLLGLNK